MREALRLTILCCAISFLFSGVLAGARSDGTQDCKLIVQALEAVKKLKAGMFRADLAKDFEQDGGVSFRQQGRYLYKKCRYIKVDIEFSGRDMTTRVTPLPDDQITSISRPYLEYPLTD